MKTKYLLTLLWAGLAFPLLSMAQTSSYRSYFGKEFTHWYTFHEFYDMGFTELYEIDGRDTLLSNGINYKQIIKQTRFYFGMREETETGSLFINTDETSEMLVSTMNLQEGDKFYFPSSTLFDDYDFEGIKSDEKGNYTLVDSVYYEDGRKHIRFEAHYFAFCYDIPLMFIEGIGPNISFDSFIGETWFSVCFLYYETETESWKNMHLKARGLEEPILIYKGECLFSYTNISDVKETFPFKLSQQEGKIEIQLNNGLLKQGVAGIYSIDGKLLASKAFRNKSSVDFTTVAFSQSVCIIRIKDTETGRAWSKKINNTLKLK